MASAQALGEDRTGQDGSLAVYLEDDRDAQTVQSHFGPVAYPQKTRSQAVCRERVARSWLLVLFPSGDNLQPPSLSSVLPIRALVGAVPLWPCMKHHVANQAEILKPGPLGHKKPWPLFCILVLEGLLKTHLFLPSLHKHLLYVRPQSQ